MNFPKPVKRILWILITVFLLMNVIAYFHAYKFTHFDRQTLSKVRDAKEFTFGQNLNALVLGVSMPRPENSNLPVRPYETIQLKSNKKIEGWLIKADSAKGTVILCHGYVGKKSSMLDKADIFLEAGYNTLLIDFMGSGGSEGIQTTIGFFEAQQVKSAYDYLWNKGERKLILYGTSMGSAAIMKAQNDYQLEGTSLILECPFGTMLETVQARFKALKVPSFPMDRLLVFWGGVQNGFNAFKHNPEDYAKGLHCPVLLLSGQLDDKVSIKEIQTIYDHLRGKKTLRIYPRAGHENYLNKYRDEWTRDVHNFLD